MKEIIISKNESGQRFDKFLGKYLTHAGRSFLYKMMRKKNITLNNKKATGNEILSEGDTVKLFFSDETFEKFSKKESEVALPELNLDIIYEDDDILLINKPAGLLSQKAKPSDISLTEYVVEYVRNKVDEENFRAFTPSVTNRLDRNTSGLITAGKSLKGLQYLSESFKERKATKYYLAIVKGEIKDEIHFSAYLSKNKETNTVEIFDNEVAGSSQIKTDIYPLSTANGYSLVKVNLLTGKTHQIRASLFKLGYPIVGDRKYFISEDVKAKRQMLHSYELILDGKTYKARVPEDFNKIMSLLGLTLGE